MARSNGKSLFCIMVRHVISVCMFCLLCATHSPCASHAEVIHSNQRYDRFTQKPPILSINDNISREKEKNEFMNKRNSEDDVLENNNNNINIFNNNNKSDNTDFYLKSIFMKYGDGKVLTMDGFKQLIKHVNELSILNENLTIIDDDQDDGADNGDNFTNHLHSPNESCTRENLYNYFNHHKKNDKINSTTFKEYCPILLSNILINNCENKEKNLTKITPLIVKDISTTTKQKSSSTFLIWMYSIGAVFLISACGVFAVIIIPVMQKRFYKPLLQFLVALAVGTLAGDALLHLLPHAMSSGHGSYEIEHGTHGHGHEHEDDHENMWKGFVAMLGLTLFFTMERFIPLIFKRKRNKGHSHVTVLDSSMDNLKKTQCMDKYNPYPRCYKDIINDPHTTLVGNEDNMLMTRMEDNNKKLNSIKQHCPCESTNNINKELKDNPQNHKQQDILNKLRLDKQDDLMQSEINKMLPEHDLNDDRDDYTVILREHGANHHGHSHVHGHVHAAPQDFSSVAWMVIMGDGLHNFTDGMAIGAAFSGSLTGGFSTTVAVFCHELPHELGDFAMLIKAGMSIKQALFYNILSSILCIFGNILGLWLGNTESASSWVFAVAAGTFIYIALVDMIPELSSEHEDEGNLIQSILHLGGLLLGFGIMTLIALYEHDLKNIFAEPS